MMLSASANAPSFTQGCSRRPTLLRCVRQVLLSQRSRLPVPTLTHHIPLLSANAQDACCAFCQKSEECNVWIYGSSTCWTLTQVHFSGRTYDTQTQTAHSKTRRHPTPTFNLILSS
jgi:hypothetical protein